MTWKARVIGGRLILDEPVNLPEGTELELGLADPGDDLSDDERKALEAAIDESLEEEARGETYSAEEVLAELGAKR